MLILAESEHSINLVDDAEASRRARSALIRFGPDIQHFCRWWPARKPFAHGGKLSVAAADQGFDTAIGDILYPSTDTEPFRFTPSVMAEAHALHIATNAYQFATHNGSGLSTVSTALDEVSGWSVE